ncbi:unnamed protein product [Caretta caretta]
MPQAPSTGSSLIRDPSIAHRNTQILWTEVDRDLAQDTRFTACQSSILLNQHEQLHPSCHYDKDIFALAASGDAVRI